MKALFIFLAIVLSFSKFTYSQIVYTVDGNHDELLRVDLGTCETEKVLSDFAANDIAFEGGVLYGIHRFGSLFFSDIKTGVMINIPNTEVFNGSVALVGDGKGNLYGAGYKLYKYNISTGETEEIADLFSLGYVASGDLEFLNGELYITLNDIDKGWATLKKVNLSPFSLEHISGLPHACYGLMADDATGELYLGMNTSFYTCNMEVGYLELVCENTFYGDIYGMSAPPSEDESVDSEVEVTQNIDMEVVMINSPSAQSGNYIVLDLLGRLVEKGNISQGINVLDISSYSSGNYVLKTMFGSKEQSNFILCP